MFRIFVDTLDRDGSRPTTIIALSGTGSAGMSGINGAARFSLYPILELDGPNLGTKSRAI